MLRPEASHPGAAPQLRVKTNRLSNQETRGRLIVLEGIDGAGTTTQTELLAAHLRGRGRRALATREPSDGPVGRLLREMLLGQHRTASGEPVAGATMALLFAADRVDHLQREIEPALAAGGDVVTDRYLLSSLAYQAEESNRGWVATLARGVRPADLTILIDLPLEVAAARRRQAGRPVERYDADSYLARVAANYRALAATTPGVVVIDGRPPADEVARAIAAEVDRLPGEGEVK
jgi:dTMP kinase